MVLDFSELEEPPFSNAPDARYLYASPTHREALPSFLYGVTSQCGSVAGCGNALGARNNYAVGRPYDRGSGGADTIVHLHPALWQVYAGAS